MGHDPCKAAATRICFAGTPESTVPQGVIAINPLAPATLNAVHKVCPLLESGPKWRTLCLGGGEHD